MFRPLLAVIFAAVLAGPGAAQDAPSEPPMTMERLFGIVTALDPDARSDGRTVELVIEDVPVLVIVDPVADRMRAMVPIRSAAGLEPAELMRLMQANFDTALDARYAVAQGRLWGVFIHPLSPLEREQFISGIVQTVNLARTYGATYSGGGGHFGGGDSRGLYLELLDEFLERGQEL